VQQLFEVARLVLVARIARFNLGVPRLAFIGQLDAGSHEAHK
jgi:hypothetical protein